MKTEIATGATIKAVEGFDAAALKKAETVEKNSLPDQEGMIKYIFNENYIFLSVLRMLNI